MDGKSDEAVSVGSEKKRRILETRRMAVPTRKKKTVARAKVRLMEYFAK